MRMLSLSPYHSHVLHVYMQKNVTFITWERLGDELAMYVHTVVSRAKRPCTSFQGATVSASTQTYGILIPGKRPCGPKLRVMFKRPWALTRDTTVISEYV